MLLALDTFTSTVSFVKVFSNLRSGIMFELQDFKIAAAQFEKDVIAWSM